MRKFSTLLLVLAFLLPLGMPFAFAQEATVVQTRLEEYNANLPAGYGNVSVQDLSAELIDNPSLRVVDVRQPEEYAEGFIPGAINIPLRDLTQNLDLLPDLDEPIVVYCGSGFRSVMAMTSLQILGYTDVRSMGGGIGAWNAEEYGTETEPMMAEAATAPDIDPEILAAVDAGLQAIPEGWGAVKAVDLNIELIENPPDMLIDVRTPDEWATGYIAGAVSMPLEQFMSFADQWPADKDANIVVYCKGGHRGNMAATMLRVMGYTNVRNLAGGITAWVTEELPIEGATEAAAPSADPILARLEEYNANLPAGYGNVSVQDLSAELIDNPSLRVVDVRQPEEYAEGFIPGAINIPLRELAQNLDLLPDLDEPVVVYCGSGFRSVMAMTSLQILGYTDVRSMGGGIGAWNAEEYGTETEPMMAEAATAPDIDPEILAAVDAGLQAIPEGWGAVKAVDLNIELIENPPDMLIDVRTPDEWMTGYIAGAVSMPLEQFTSFADQWPADKDANIVVYCKGGHRGNMAATMLRVMGYTNVRNLAGGITAWVTEELPIEGAQ